MKFYHGSSCRDITEFVIRNKSVKKDFGKGVYLTTNFEQAKKWSCKYSNTGAVYEFELELASLKQRDLSDSEDLYYVLYLCRIGLEEIAEDVIDGFKADIVSGLMLSSNVKKFKRIATRFNKGDMSYEQFCAKVKLFKKGWNQYCVKTEQALSEINDGLVKKYLTRNKKGKVEVEAVEIIKNTIL